MKNQVLIAVFHLYFIRMKIREKARAKERISERREGSASSSGDWSPKGRLFWVIVNSPVVWLNVENGE